MSLKILYLLDLKTQLNFSHSVKQKNNLLNKSNTWKRTRPNNASCKWRGMSRKSGPTRDSKRYETLSANLNKNKQMSSQHYNKELSEGKKNKEK